MSITCVGIVAISLDSRTRKKLVIIKMIYYRATVFAKNEHSLSDRVMASILFDLTVETTFYTLLISNSSGKQAHTFSELIKNVNQLLSQQNKSLPPTSSIKHVHLIRNNAQHHLIFPTKSDLDDCRIYVRNFLNDFLKEVYGIDFTKLSLTTLIHNSGSKQCFVNAETAIDQGNYNEAVKLANIGFWTAFNHAGQGSVGYPIYPDLYRIKLKSDVVNTEYREENVTIALRLIQDSVRNLALGVNHLDFSRFSAIAGTVHIDSAGKYTVKGIANNIGRGDAEFVLSFAIDKVVQFEDRVGDLIERSSASHTNSWNYP